jgi:hypothetical protein
MRLAVRSSEEHSTKKGWVKEPALARRSLHYRSHCGSDCAYEQDALALRRAGFCGRADWRSFDKRSLPCARRDGHAGELNQRRRCADQPQERGGRAAADRDSVGIRRARRRRQAARENRRERRRAGRFRDV